ncbi:membrane metallo-endopeptidase-like 1-like protein [Dinothrombium tinctorium]|uniref:Membrane metallo-endopeptidase-like 1-like protein n=1 Tax=Dinothrombium tinctorium TaxID=1965070 RepID=A0A3S3NNK8_9ACAR|nr:membrane metallo-endopeptidase-like 1-like protein [Dinothrombium tinctorium]
MAKITDIIVPLRRSSTSCSPLSRLEKLLVITLFLITILCISLFISLVALMCQRVSPCDDFYEFACGGENQNGFMPEDRTNLWRASLLQSEVDKKLKGGQSHFKNLK